MRRVFWMAVGATVAVLVVRRVNRLLDAASPEGIGRSLNAAADSVREFADDIRTGMAQREQELRVALGVEPGTMDAEGVAEGPLAPPHGGRHSRGY
ncbi:MAG: DUF6167 family protein [Kineosporiaceae bacterium]